MSIPHEPVRSSPVSLRAGNLAASFIFATLAVLVYLHSPHTLKLRLRWHEHLHVTGGDALILVYVIYGLALLGHCFSTSSTAESRALQAMGSLVKFCRRPREAWRAGLDRDTRQAWLSILVKAFFAPLMVLYLCGALSAVLGHGGELLASARRGGGDVLQLFDSHGFWFLFQLTVLVDVCCYTFGYLVEHRALRNEIRSVDPSWVGWLAALACYPPFNAVTVKILGGNVADFPHFANSQVHIAMNLLLLLAMAVYASASVALGWKASNLTHRGIVSAGPYALVRHPAYVAKNIAWWIATLPAVALAAQRSWSEVALVCGAAAAWSGLYVLRALTEEDHLRSVDGDYTAYCARVPYRFLPGLI